MTAQEESQVLLVKEEAFEADERRHNGRYRRFLLRGVAFGAACVVVCWATVGLPLLQPNSAEDGAAEVPHPFFDEQSLSEKFSLLDCKRTCARICPVLRDRLAQYRVRSAKEVPSRFGLDLTFYKKYVNVMGIPVLSSDLVCDCVLQKAAWIVHGTTSHLKRMPEVLKKMVQNKHRVAIMARSEKTTDVPEHARLKPKDFWDRRARGLGATPHAPCSSAGEESVMCESFKTNGYFGENIFLHELTHGLARTGFKFLKWDGQDWDDYNGAVYKASLEKGLWKNTYAATNKIEFFGEAVQAWFDANLRPPECAKDNHITNGIHNCFHDRQKLRTYDPGLYQHIAGVFKDGSWRPGHSESCGCGHPDAIVEGFAAVDADGNLKDGGGSADGTGGITPSPDDDSSEVPVPTEQCLELKTHASCVAWPGCEWDHGHAKCFHLCSTVESESACWPTGECAWDASSKKCHTCIAHANKQDVAPNGHKHCKSWARSGECSRNPGFMLNTCAQACATTNSHQHCEFWARAGECAKNPGYMLKTCPQSCGCKQLQG